MNISGNIATVSDGHSNLKFDNIPDLYILTIKKGRQGLSLYGERIYN